MSHTQTQVEQLRKLEDIRHEQRMKLQRYKKFEHKLDEQAVHFEVMLSRLSKSEIDDKLSKTSAQYNAQSLF